MAWIIKAIYADGGTINGHPSTVGGMWAFCHVNAAGERIREERGIFLREDHLPWVETNVAEMVALTNGLMALPEGWAGHVYSDSKNTLERVFGTWACNGIPPWLMEHMRHAKRHITLKHCTPVLLKGHPNKRWLNAGFAPNGRPVSIHNVWCDAACTDIALTYYPPAPVMHYGAYRTEDSQ